MGNGVGLVRFSAAIVMGKKLQLILCKNNGCCALPMKKSFKQAAVDGD